MKHLILLTFILIFTSCNNDESIAEQVVGDWRLETIAINSCPDSSNNIAAVNADNEGCAVFNGIMVCQNIEIRSDGTLTNTSVTDGMTDIQERSYTVDEEAMQLTSCDQNNDCATVLVLDNRLSLSSQFGDCIIISTYVK